MDIGNCLLHYWLYIPLISNHFYWEVPLLNNCMGDLFSGISGETFPALASSGTYPAQGLAAAVSQPVPGDSAPYQVSTMCTKLQAIAFYNCLLPTPADWVAAEVLQLCPWSISVPVLTAAVHHHDCGQSLQLTVPGSSAQAAASTDMQARWYRAGMAQPHLQGRMRRSPSER